MAMKIFHLFFLIQWSLILRAELSADNSFIDCHHIVIPGKVSDLGICFQRDWHRGKLIHLEDAALICSLKFTPDGHWIDLNSLSSTAIDELFKTLPQILNMRYNNQSNRTNDSNYQWITAGQTRSSTLKQHWCPLPCHSSKGNEKYLELNTRCRTTATNQPCLTSESISNELAVFLCAYNRRIQGKKLVIEETSSITRAPQDSKKTILFHDSKSCLIARTETHQYSFCFRRQSCPHSQTSAFCTTKNLAQNICQTEKNHSNLLIIESEDEYNLINEIIGKYANETLLNIHGQRPNKNIVRAQWMWVNGIRGLNETYQWSYGNRVLMPIMDHWWCDQIGNCSGGKGRDHVVLNIVCENQNKRQKICLASRRHSEPGPFICKRRLTDNEDPVANYVFLDEKSSTIPTSIIPIYDKNFTSVYYDENHCLTVQTQTYLYTFCFRRQMCHNRQAYCTKWIQAQKKCQSLDDQAQLLTIDNHKERELITDIVDQYRSETRLAYNGSSYRYFRFADYMWIDGIQQENNQTYYWNNQNQIIPDDLWCPQNDCDSIGREHVTLNLLCRNQNKLICLGTRPGWKLAPYACKRPRPIDHCPILFDRIRSIEESSMLIITSNRSIALIKCKHPDYNTQIKVSYHCDAKTKQWNLIDENLNYTCPIYDIPPLIIATTRISSSTTEITTLKDLSESNCSETQLTALVAHLPVSKNYLTEQQLTSYAPSSYYDQRMTCRYNKSIHITYRCDRIQNRWIYVHGNSKDFYYCYPPCSEQERSLLLNKYFTKTQQSSFRIVRLINDSSSIRLRCFNNHTRRWNRVIYRCGQLSFNQSQLSRLNSCFPGKERSELPVVTVSMAVKNIPTHCSSPVLDRNSCDHPSGQYIIDQAGCPRKVCPATSQLCRTIRCPPDRICRVITCQTCTNTGYLRPVCEHSPKVSLCEMQQQLLSLVTQDSIIRWEQQTLNLVRQLAREKQDYLSTSRPALTTNQ